MGIWFHYIALSQVPFAGGYSPPAYADVDTTFNSYVNNIFGFPEPGRVSTGLWADYAFEFTGLCIYNANSMTAENNKSFRVRLYNKITQTAFNITNKSLSFT